MSSIIQRIYTKSLEQHSKHNLSELYDTTQGDFKARICLDCHIVLIYISEWQGGD